MCSMAGMPPRIMKFSGESFSKIASGFGRETHSSASGCENNRRKPLYSPTSALIRVSESCESTPSSRCALYTAIWQYSQLAANRDTANLGTIAPLLRQKQPQRRPLVAGGALRRRGEQEVVAGDLREAAEVVGVGEAGAAGGEALVAAGGDRKAVAGRDLFGHRLPQGQPRLSCGKAMRLDLDRKPGIGAGGPAQAACGEQPVGKSVE